MGYRIEYGPDRQKNTGFSSKTRRILFTLTFFSLFALLTRLYWPAGWQLLMRTLIPGDPEVTLPAAESFLQELRWGNSLTDAMDTFCRTILLHETLPGN